MSSRQYLRTLGADTACRYCVYPQVGGQAADRPRARRREDAASVGIDAKAEHALARLQLDPALPMPGKDQVAHRQALRCSSKTRPMNFWSCRAMM